MFKDGAMIDQLSTIISHAVAPAFLLGAVAGFIGILNTRMNSILNRARFLNNMPDDAQHAYLKADVPRLKRRAALINRALLCVAGSGIAAAILVIVAFLSAFIGVSHVHGAGLLFIVAMLFLIAGLVIFALELRIALTEYDHF